MKNPAPDNAANTGLTCELCCLVVNGRVEGATGRCPPIAGIGVMVLVVGATVEVGYVWPAYGATVLTGARVVGVVATGAVVAGAVVALGTVVGGGGTVVPQIKHRVVGGAVVPDPAVVGGPAATARPAEPVITDTASAADSTTRAIWIAVTARRRSITTVSRPRRHPRTASAGTGEAGVVSREEVRSSRRRRSSWGYRDREADHDWPRSAAASSDPFRNRSVALPAVRRPLIPRSTTGCPRP
jgi:hypothetical protein